MKLTPADELEGRTALVTGGSGDIGSAIVRALARRGANVVIHYHRNQAQAQSLCDEIKTLGVASLIVGGDLADEEQIKTIVQESRTLGPIGILINNAGTPIRRAPWLEIKADFLDEVFNLNFRAPLYLSQQVAPDMAQRGRGVIINILSTAAHIGGTDTVLAYGAAKGALFTFTKGLARTLAPQGVRVLAVSPGTIDTGIQRNLTPPEIMQQLLSNNPLGRAGRPEEIGEIVAFLATDHASFVVGETIEVNGGVYMR